MNKKKLLFVSIETFVCVLLLYPFFDMPITQWVIVGVVTCILSYIFTDMELLGLD